MSREWVCLDTYGDDREGTLAEGKRTLYEEGAVYTGRVPALREAVAHRDLQPEEHIVACPRCGQRFAATESATAESHRDLHFDGDEVPSICAHLPWPPLRVVK